jgi:hypothetical protein
MRNLSKQKGLEIEEPRPWRIGGGRTRPPLEGSVLPVSRRARVVPVRIAVSNPAARPVESPVLQRDVKGL